MRTVSMVLLVGRGTILDHSNVGGGYVFALVERTERSVFGEDV